MNRIMISTLLLAACFIWSNTAAQTVQVPNNFQAGTTARASEVNENFSAIANGVNSHAAELETLIARIDDLEGQISALEARMADAEANTVLKLDGRLDLDMNDPEFPRAVFAGVNVQLVNGTGRTNEINGLGNLLVGYDEERVGGALLCSDGQFDDQSDCVNNGESWSNSHKSGSHNIVVGMENNYSNYAGLVSGMGNSITSRFATVTGGWKNLAAGPHASVSGGVDNQALGLGSSVTGGGGDDYQNPGKPRGNKAIGDYATVAGGTNNRASGQSSFVAGGAENRATGPFAAIAGGDTNTASGYQSTVAGGIDNLASGEDSAVSGGRMNTAAGPRSTVSGGFNNLAQEEEDHRP